MSNWILKKNKAEEPTHVEQELLSVHCPQKRYHQKSRETSQEGHLSFLPVPCWSFQGWRDKYGEKWEEGALALHLAKNRNDIMMMWVIV